MSNYLQRLIRPPATGAVRSARATAPTAFAGPANTAVGGANPIEQEFGEVETVRVVDSAGVKAEPSDLGPNAANAASTGMTFQDVVHWVTPPAPTPRRGMSATVVDAVDDRPALESVAGDSHALGGAPPVAPDRVSESVITPVTPRRQAEQAPEVMPTAEPDVTERQMRIPEASVAPAAAIHEPFTVPAASVVPVQQPEVVLKDAHVSHRPGVRSPPVISVVPTQPTYTPSQRSVEVRIGSIALVVKNSPPERQTVPPAPSAAPPAADVQPSRGPAEWRFSASRHYLRRS